MHRELKKLFQEIVNTMPAYGHKQSNVISHKLAFYRIPIQHLADARAVVSKFRPQLRKMRVRVAYEWIGPRPETRYRDPQVAFLDVIANGPRSKHQRRSRCLKEFATGFAIHFHPGLG